MEYPFGYFIPRRAHRRCACFACWGRPKPRTKCAVAVLSNTPDGVALPLPAVAHSRTPRGKKQVIQTGGTATAVQNNLPFSVEMLEKIADFFGVSTDYLLGRVGKKTTDGQTIDVTGLTPRQIEHVKLIVEDFCDV